MKRFLWTICWLFFLCGAQSGHAVDAAAGGAEAAFDVWELQVEGNTVLSARDIERAVSPYLGGGKTVKDMDKAREALEQAYRDQGYPTVLVDLPEQQVNHGMVRLHVTEGKIAHVNVNGARYHLPTRIRGNMPALQEGAILYLPEFQRQIAAVSRSPDERVTPVLRPGKTPGTMDIDLKVEDHLPLHASLELNDRYSANTTRARLLGSVRYDNLWQRNHSLSVQYQTSPENSSEVRVWVASYLLPLSAPGDMIAAYAVNSHSNVAAVGDTNVIGRGTIYGLRYIVSLPAIDQYYQTMSLGADYKDFRESITVAGADSVNTPISYLPLTAQYNATAQGKRGVTRYNAGVNFSLRGLADGNIDCLGQQVNEFACKRYKARPDYVYFKGGVQRTQRLPRSWELSAAVDVQVADQPLISNEQYSAGGADTVRGYLESERMGDDGWRGSLEVHGPALSRGRVDSLFPLAFVDGAELRTIDPLPAQQAHFDLLSAGLGMRLKAFSRRLSLDMDGAYPFKDGATVHAGDARLHMRLSYEF